METRLLQTLPGSISFSSDLTRPEPTISDPATEEAILDGARRLKAGELVAFPSETVYGLGANALNGEAVGKIYQAKGNVHVLVII
jgi:tRNA A37 threonylcarbamoyladenosine synthetase subunit TsaC/SUA5/YrdC